jgi:2-oxo-3-hexenedioate decarboxylase
VKPIDPKPRLERVADQLLAALDSAHCIALPSTAPGGLSVDEAYLVSEHLQALRIARGERPLGWKIGFTNRKIWDRYGVYSPIWGPVWDTTAQLLDGTETRLSLAGLSQPRLEPEIVFGFASAPRAGMDLEALRGCIAWVAHGFEVVHTHFAGWNFGAADCLADFALHGYLRVGPRRPVADWPSLGTDLAALRIALFRDGERVDSGVGTNVLDGPLNALRLWIDAMAEKTPRWRVQPGEFVTTGTLTDAWPLAPGQRWHTELQMSQSPIALPSLVLHTMT